jgi:predicted RNase H-like nuclease (RuvC/YqgF family)
MWSNGGSWRSPWRWGLLGVLLLVTLVSSHPQTTPFDSLKQALLTLKTQVSELQAKINTLELSLSESATLAEQSKTIISNLESQLQTSQTRINTLLIASSEALQKSEVLQALATTLQAQLNESRESLRDLKNYLSKLEGERIVTIVGVGLTATAAGITIGYLIWGLKR